MQRSLLSQGRRLGDADATSARLEALKPVVALLNIAERVPMGLRGFRLILARLRTQDATNAVHIATAVTNGLITW